MRFDRNVLLSVLSEALDRVEGELLGVTDHHGKRVAWLCMRMGQQFGMSVQEQTDLAVCALFHDSALNEYRNDYSNGKPRTGMLGQRHSAAGERLVSIILGKHSQIGAVLYHHELANGNGDFGITCDQTPLGGQIIHIADDVDRYFSTGSPSVSLETIRRHVRDKTGTEFGLEVSNCFLDIFSDDCIPALAALKTSPLNMPPVWWDTDNEDGMKSVRTIAEFFAKIVDYKSPFTRVHSLGTAEKAERMAAYEGLDKQTTTELYFAGAFHDLGKMMINRDVLEKRGRLDDKEFQHIQLHAYETWRLLSKVPGLERVTRWASHHHEKLNGKGYPFGMTAEELGHEERLMTCLDIYQALTEDRPYKSGMSHSQTLGILQDMVSKGELDGDLVAELDRALAPGNGESTEQKENLSALFQCRLCGYIYEGNVVPESYQCPVCSARSSDFLRME